MLISLSKLEPFCTYEIFKNQSFKITIDPELVNKEYKKNQVMTVDVTLTNSLLTTASFKISFTFIVEEEKKDSTKGNKSSNLTFVKVKSSFNKTSRT